MLTASAAFGQGQRYGAALERMHESELPVIRKVQSHSNWAAVMHIISDIGVSKANWFVIAFIFFAISPRVALQLTLFYVLGLAMREVLAIALHSPRPWWIDPATGRYGDVSLSRPTFGFPSGHAMMGGGFWLYLGVESRRPWALVCAAVLAVLICVSRVFLGAHFISDVVLGITLGALYVWVYRRAVLPSWEKVPPRSRLLAGVFLCAGLFAAACLARLAAAGPFVPQWAGLAEKARTIVNTAGYCGMFLGAGAALSMAPSVSDPWRAWQPRLIGLAATGLLIIGVHYYVPSMRIQPWPEPWKLAGEFVLRAVEALLLFSFVPWLAAVGRRSSEWLARGH